MNTPRCTNEDYIQFLLASPRMVRATEATRDGAPVIDLIDGDQLCLLLKDLKLGVSTQQVEEVRIDPHWFNTI